MKKAIKINLSGVIFHIDEDAYEKLKRYLDAIGRHFAGKDEGKEILNDIETRIAELFEERKAKEEAVISIALVNEVIEIMGDPEDIIDTDTSADPGNATTGNTTYTTRSRRLYRDPENSVIAGVSGGLGAYFNMDPLIFRILFIVFFFFGGASILIYIILWIVLPKAESAAQKLEMRGEPVNVSNIEKKVREEYESTKENVKKAANSESAKKTKQATRSFFLDIGNILLLFVKVVLILIGTAFVLAGIGIIIALLSTAFIGLQVFPVGDLNFTLGNLLAPFSDPLSISLLVISLTLLFLIPVIAMIYGLVRLIFNITSKNRGLVIGGTLLWIVALLMTISILAFETNNYSNSGISKSETELNVDSDTLIVTVNTKNEKEFRDGFEFYIDNKWLMTDDLDRIYGQIDLDIEQSDTDKLILNVEKRSKGRNYEEADENASKLNYSYTISENNLVLDPYFFIDQEVKWRFPEVDIELEIPVGTYLYLDNETREILDNVDNVDHVTDRRMGGKMWLMSEDGLTLAEKAE